MRSTWQISVIALALGIGFSTKYSYTQSVEKVQQGQVTREERVILRYASPVHVVPTMANSPGRFGAYFKTRVVIYNPTEFSYRIQATLYGPRGEVESKYLQVEEPFAKIPR